MQVQHKILHIIDGKCERLQYFYQVLYERFFVSCYREEKIHKASSVLTVTF